MEAAPFGVVFLAVDTPKGGLLHGQKELSWPETRQRVTSYAHLHVTLYADTWLIHEE
jgi:hypothetical protein